MNWRTIAFLIGAVTLAVGPARAQDGAQLKINRVRVGFPARSQVAEGEQAPVYRAGAWTPVYVDIGVGRQGLKGTEGLIEVVVEVPDSDDMMTSYSVTTPLPKLAPEEQFTVLAYTKLATLSSEVGVSLHLLPKEGGRAGEGRELARSPKRPHNGIEASKYLYVTLGGSRPVGLRQTLFPKDAEGQSQGNANESLAYIDTADQLPDKWFGYQGADVVILATGNKPGPGSFILEFKNTHASRRQALVNWVQRGGHLIVSVGRNADVVKAITELEDLLPVQITKSEQVNELLLEWKDLDQTITPVTRDKPVEVAVLEPKPGRNLRILAKTKTGKAAVVQAPYGLGRVTVVAFDMEQKPFADSPNQSVFWRKLLPAPGRERDDDMSMRGYYGGSESLAQLQTTLENFEEVPVISFGWVALFILLYILVVGPLDYFFLKKVVKRLELTWITFPTVVLLVSAVAYFSAYHLKGNDLRINKVDLIDIDLQNQQAYGETWFTLFSPRIQNYTIGIEPASPEWAKPDTSQTLVSWLGMIESNPFGSQRRGQGGLFSRKYDYAPNGSGLTSVPIQVWSTKSFTASWQAPVNTETLPVAAKLQRGRNTGSGLKGDITWRLGGGTSKVPLKEAYLMYRGQAYALGEMAPESKRAVENLVAIPIRSWVADVSTESFPTPNLSRRNYPGEGPPSSVQQIIKNAMFFERDSSERFYLRTSGLRHLNQLWQVSDRDEGEVAILVGRLGPQQGSGEEVSQHLASSCRLWLGSLPGQAERPGQAPPERPKLIGKLRQETYVRVIIPVKDR